MCLVFFYLVTMGWDFDTSPYLRVFAMKEFRGRFLRDISTGKATNFVPI